MEKIKWDETLVIGIASIDHEHKMLIERLNSVIEAIDKHLDEGTTAKTLDFLLDYTNFHFSNEENLMIAHEYPGLEHQQKQHAEFKKDVYQLILDFQEDGASKNISQQIKELLLVWLIKHIMEVDLKLAEFINEEDSGQ